jgi:hypothetical protein
VNHLINSVLNYAKQHPLVTVIVAAGIALLLILLIWFYGTRAINGMSNWWYSRGTQSAHENIDKLKGDAAAAKAVAEEALKELALEKERYKVEKEKREVAERLLNDRTKTSNEKLRLYEEAINKAPTVSAPASVDDLCARARAAGISCE